MSTPVVTLMLSSWCYGIFLCCITCGAVRRSAKVGHASYSATEVYGGATVIDLFVCLHCKFVHYIMHG